MERWIHSLTAVAATGNVIQLYPAWAPAGVNPATATNGQYIRSPQEGILYGLQVETDGINGGTIELFDINGLDGGVDVSSSNVITNAQAAALIAAGKAKKIYEQNFQAAPSTPINVGYSAFLKGLAARFSNDNAAPGPQGTCSLNLTTSGSWKYNQKVG